MALPIAHHSPGAQIATRDPRRDPLSLSLSAGPCSLPCRTWSCSERRSARRSRRAAAIVSSWSAAAAVSVACAARRSLTARTRSSSVRRSSEHSTFELQDGVIRDRVRAHARPDKWKHASPFFRTSGTSGTQHKRTRSRNNTQNAEPTPTHARAHARTHTHTSLLCGGKWG